MLTYYDRVDLLKVYLIKTILQKHVIKLNNKMGNYGWPIIPSS